MTENSMSEILGPKFKEVDSYDVRARMPSPPFQFVDRVLKLNADIGVLKAKSSIEFEYDIPVDSMFSLSFGMSQVPLFESGHAGILLMGLIGSDFSSKGQTRFRVTDTELTFLGPLPQAGQTINGRFTVTDLIQNASKLVVFYDFDLFQKDGSPIFKSKGLGGFFSKDELEDSKGVKTSNIRLHQRRLSSHELRLTSHINEFNYGDLTRLSMGGAGKNKQLIFNEKIRVVDKITSVSSFGGEHGLGEIVGEWKIPESHWMFDAHFKNDPIMPGMMMLEGASQCFRCLSIIGGFVDSNDSKIDIQPIQNNPIKTWFRGQVKKGSGKLVYKLSIKDLSYSNNRSHLVCDVKIYHNDKLIVVCNSISAEFKG